MRGGRRSGLTPFRVGTPIRETETLPPDPPIEREVEGRRRLAGRLGHRFDDETLFGRSLTHRSAGREHNERLEFLGDALLNFVVAEALYRRVPRAREGQLTRARARLVCRSTLADLARTLDLGAALELGDGELKSGGRGRDSILANAFEALAGAFYLDAGLGPCRSWLLDVLAERLNEAVREDTSKDPKSALQEALQAHGLPRPEYAVIEVSGAAHARKFSVSCRVSGLDEAAAGTGKSRREAEQAAARHALDLLGRRPAR